MAKGDKRTFTVHDARHSDGCATKFANKDYTGVYVSRSHMAAASKAFTQLCGVKDIKGQCSLYISMRETTQGSPKKVLTYKATRVKLKEPVELQGRTIEFTNDVKSAKSMPSCKTSSKSSGKKARRKSRKSRKSRK